MLCENEADKKQGKQLQSKGPIPWSSETEY